MQNRSSSLIYMDNAATSWPKPPGVAAAMAAALATGIANPGRGSHRLAIESSRQVLAARQELCALLGLPAPLRLVFTANVTEALNLVLWGWLRPGDRVVTTSVEHNAVMRPLHALQSRRGVVVHQVAADAEGHVSAAAFARALEPGAALAVVNHASNVVGTILPLAEIAAACRARHVPLLVDAAQTAGSLPLDATALGVDMLAFTGHKGLMGPTGTGGLYLADTVDTERLQPLIQGGTGSRSESEDQPDFLPDRYESGTMNVVGIIGLLEAARYLRALTVEEVRKHERRLTATLMEGLAAVPRVRLYGPREADRRVAVVSFTIDGLDVAETAFRLDEEFGIMARAGLHCAPGAHKAIGTFPTGTVRLGLSRFSTAADVDAVVAAIAALAKG
ncbi:MAG: aminotransferase class V-fold PLP-dependent enzyme [Anaerolineae bacterium]